MDVRRYADPMDAGFLQVIAATCLQKRELAPFFHGPMTPIGLLAWSSVVNWRKLLLRHTSFIDFA
jgi:hypothetical protein